MNDVRYAVDNYDYLNINKDIAVKLLSGYLLMVLTKNKLN